MPWYDFFKPQKAKQRATDMADAFNFYQTTFASLDATEESVDLTLTVRIRAFGSEVEKQKEWDRCWRTPEQQASREKPWGKAAAGVNVSSNPPEVWMDLRMSKGGLILPMGVLAHELVHSIHNADKRVVNPDLLINKDIY